MSDASFFTVEAYLKSVRALKEQSQVRKSSDLAYAGVEDFLLKHGEEFAILKRRPRQYSRMRVKQCFHNNGLLVRIHPELTYCEGYAATEFFPIHHAWSVDKRGRVVEVTLAKPALQYIGVRFPTNYVLDTQIDENGSLLMQWQNNHPILRTPWDEQPFRKGLPCQRLDTRA